MDGHPTQTAKPRKTRWRRTVIALMIVVFIIVAMLLLFVEPIARWAINKSLQRYLTGGGQLAAIDINLASGRAELSGLTINAPEGFGSTPLASLKKLVVDITPLSIFSEEITVEELRISDMSMTLVRNKDGRLSVRALIPDSNAADAHKADDTAEASGLPTLPAIKVDALRLEAVEARLIDNQSGQDWTAKLGLNMAVDDVEIIDLPTLGILVGNAKLAVNNVHVDQLKGFSEAPLLAIDTVRVETAGVDLSSQRLPISTVAVDNLTASAERNADGDINVIKLLASWLPGKTGAHAEKRKAAEASTAAAASPAFALPTVVFEDVQLTAMAAQMLDRVAGETWRAGFDRLDIGLNNMAVGDVAKKAVSIGSFILDLNGVTVDQPHGFGGDALATLAAFSLDAEELDLSASALAIKEITVQEPSATLVVRKDGASNVKKLIEALVPEEKQANDKSSSPPPDPDQPSPEAVLPVLLFESVMVEKGSMILREESLSETALVIPIQNANLSLSGLRLFDSNMEASPATADFSFEMIQPNELPKAFFGAKAIIGPVNVVPPVNAQWRFIGIKLDTFGELVPPGTRTALGATGLDTEAAMALDTDAINLFASILTDRNIRYDAIHVYGPLKKPTVEVADILAGAFSRVTDGLLNLGGSGLDAGVSIAKGGVEVVGEVGAGAWGLGKNLGGSAVELGVGLLTFDGDKVQDGLEGATRDTIALTADSVKDAGAAAGGGLSGSVDDLKGDKAVQAWDRAVPERYEAAMRQAETALTNMPYPPAFNQNR
jgi:uncharacterized protein involved in outer membrane biogenesis